MYLFRHHTKYLKHKFGKRKQSTINKTHKFAYYYNSSRISFFKPRLKETVVTAVFIFELNSFQIFDQEMTYFFVIYLFYKAVYSMPYAI